MLFNSIEFALFLPIVFLLYWFVFSNSEKTQNSILLAASYFFYGWWNWKCLGLIFLVSLISWFSAIYMEKRLRLSKYVFSTSIIFLLGILGLFKYYDFFISSFANLFNFKSEKLLLNLILPIGISFYIFQAIGYLIDVYKRKTPATRDIILYFTFLGFFPQLIAGPIERASNVIPQFSKKRSFNYTQSVDGCRQVLWGLFKKVVVADNCGFAVNQIFETYSSQPSGILLVGALLFTFQIYGDFSGYSDMAVGCAKLFGINLTQNFKNPYFSKNIADFWRRWHISLTNWFRDYIYIPLGGNRISKTKTIFNTLVIFLLCGIWHGANWTFFAWGLYNAFLFIPHVIFPPNQNQQTVFHTIVRQCFTFILVVLGWILFRSATINDAWHYLINMCNFDVWKASYLYFMYPSHFGNIFALILLAIEWMQKEKTHALELSSVNSVFLRWIIYFAVIFTIIFFKAYEKNPFIYFQF
ncbi:MAG: MBOAT family protein [Bacteroidales bacterium]|nr:MBOAT family protein [Bacteroidales bacterium]